ncbi:MAG: TlyA family RNA methyltransferase [Terrimicrobiaceae bacterium]|nr:TlyA family RNA methyltransferase [Terrimicrobiaceae bacterium]
MSGKSRLDLALVERGLIESREKAQRAIMAGLVTVDGRPATKAGQSVAADAAIEISGRDKYVGRGGLKLEAALDTFAIDPSGRVCIDVGASTGGFTDCLLQRGAASVYAVDVGHGQLDWRLRQDARVDVREGVNARYLRPEEFDPPPSLAVADVSFISLTMVLPAVFELMAPSFDMVVLIKPQFELGRDDVGRGGIVREPVARERAVERIRTFVCSAGRIWQGVRESPITGRDGNVEFLAHIR